MMEAGLERARLYQRPANIAGWPSIGLLLLALLVVPWTNTLRADEHVYTLAIVPQYTPLFIHRNWQPLLTRLHRDTGIRLEVKTYSDFRQFLSALRRGEPDFSYLAPYHLVLAKRAQGYRPLLRDDSRQLIGLLMVRKDSPLNSVHELDGKTIAFPSPNAFAASLYMRSWLHKKVGIDFTPRYVGTHDNVYRHIVRGQVHAGSGVNSTLASQPAGLQQRLRVLYEVPGVAAHPFAVHPRVPGQIQTRVQEVMLELIKDGEGRELLKAIQVAEPVKADYQRDYSHLETMVLE
jgi:phosphonate transport system substrate-binding protein